MATRPLQLLTVTDLVEVLDLTADSMAAHAAGLDALDAVAMADGDTGENLAATTRALARAARGHRTMLDLVRSVGAAAATEAVGRSGVVFGEFLAGAFEVLRNADGVDGERFALALEAGAQRCEHPGAGMCRVIAAAVDAALAALDDGLDLDRIVGAARDAGMAVLESVDGPVDAGGAGWMVWLEMVGAVVSGDVDDPWDDGDDPSCPDGRFSHG